MRKIIDLTGQRFEKLLVLERAEKPDNRKTKGAYWKCRCDCGNIVVFLGQSLRNGDVKSCGCLRQEKKYKQSLDPSGWVMKEHDVPDSLITIIEKTKNKSSDGHYLWKCKCECGNIFESRISCILNGSTKSCGCRKGGHFVDLTGQNFGELTAIKLLTKEECREQNKIIGKRYWLCKCSCGKEVIYDTTTLIGGKAYSCGCKRTRGLRKKEEEELEKKKEFFLNNKFNLLTPIEYIPGTRKECGSWLCKCDCGGITKATSSQLVKNIKKSCGCLFSPGEDKIKKILQRKNINFISQKTYSDLLSFKNKPLRFDFFLPDFNCCIEFQGQQHYNSKSRFYTEIGQQYDQLKRNYCKNNNIKLIEIPYWDYNKINWNYIEEKLNGQI